MYAGTLLDIAMIHSDSLIESARKGDERAISKLVSLWHKRIYNFCYKYFGDHDMAMDVAQTTFISMYRSIGSLKEVNRFKPWLYRIATNCCHDQDRKNKREMTVSYRSGDEEESNKGLENIKDEAIDPHQKLHLSELNEIVMESLNYLSPDQKEVLIMKEYEGLKFREIAETLGVSENTVKSRLYYALSHMKKILKKNRINKETAYYE